jgi:hypothetical protein
VNFYDSGTIVSADGSETMKLDGAVIVLVENGRRSYYDLNAVLDTVVSSCGRFMLDQSQIDETDARIVAAAEPH